MELDRAPASVVLSILDGQLYGGQRVCLAVLREIVDRGWACMLVSGSHGPAVDLARGYGATTCIVPAGGILDLRALIGLDRAVKMSGARLIYTHTAFPGAVHARVVGRLRGVGVVNHMHHDYWPMSQSPLKRYLQERLDVLSSQWCDRIVALYQRSASDLQSIGISSSKITVIPNCVTWTPSEVIEPALETPDSAVEIGRGLILIHIGQLCERKGQHHTIEAVGILKNRGIACTALFAGEDVENGGRYHEHLLMIARSNGVSDACVFLGYQREIANLIRAADVCVLPSMREGVPLVMLESMACGVPLVISDVGGVSEYVSHLRDAIVLAALSAESIANAIELLVLDPTMGQALARNALARVRAEYSPENFRARLWDLLEPLLGQNAPV